MTQQRTVFSVDIHDNHVASNANITSQLSEFHEVFTDTRRLHSDDYVSTRRARHCCRINRQLAWNKLFYAGFWAVIGAALPFVAVLCKQHGLSPEQIGLITGLKPAVGFLAAPVIATLVDRYRVKKWFLVFSVVAYFSFYAGLFQLPAGKRIQTCPDQVEPHRDAGLVIHKRSTNESDTVMAPLGEFVVSDGSGTSGISDRTTLSGLSETRLHSNISTGGFNDTNDTYPDYDDKHILRENISWLYDADRLRVVFWVILILILCSELFQVPTTSLADASTLQTLGPTRLGHYGYQRAWGAIGFGCG